MDKKKRALTVLKRLSKLYPQVRSQLKWNSPWELLVATILSAQCTDKKVNQVLPDFFLNWPKLNDLARASQSEVELIIRPTGVFRNKAKNLIQTAQLLETKFDSQIPSSMSELINLPGVGRKTANIILSNGFGINEGIAIDTHVKRLSYRLGLTQSFNPNQIEKDLEPLFPQKDWGKLNHLLVWFGRDTCKAVHPLCLTCQLNDICPRQGL